ncbi:MAG: HAMP domain-containing protein [Planctomycetes bacterium]|nr:HAMP domain-containing protein [Planctomycetota bacterium]MBI3845084.1 HAMP domain-containing protein [Planctomycetota bacterium]
MNPSNSPAPRPRPAGPRRARPTVLGLSLRVRVFLVMVVVIAPAMLFLSFLSYQKTREYVLQAADERGRLAAQDLAAWVAEHGEKSTEADVNGELDRRLKSGTGLLELAVFNMVDSQLVPLTARGEGLGMDVSNTLQDAVLEPGPKIAHVGQVPNRVLEVSMAAPKPGGIAAVVRARLSLREADSVITRSGVQVLVLTLVMLIVLGALLYLYMGQAVSGPVLALVNTMERVTKGERSALAEVRAGGEIGWLAVTLNHMLQNLRRSEEENVRLLAQIRRMNEDLRERVREATEELAQKNEELKAAQDRLFSTQRDLSRVERLASLGQLAGEIAHEVGTPLNAISGHIQLLRRDATLPPPARERLQIVENQVDRLAAIIRNVLTTLRPPVLAREPVDLNELLSDLLRFTAPLLEGKHIVSHLEPGADLATMGADRSQLEQVFLNLITNSMDAMPHGGEIRIRTRNVAGTTGSSGQIEVRFTDSGAGIAPEDLKRVFQPFHSSKAPGAGAGLGLAICREIVRRHGGEIRAESESGRGASVVLTFPASPSGSVEASDEST